MECDEDLDPDDPWDIIIMERGKYESLCTRLSRGNQQLREELWDEILERACSCLETWNPIAGSLAAHMWSSIRRYMWKRQVRFFQRHMRSRVEHEDNVAPDEAHILIAQDQVADILNGLTSLGYKEQAELLRLHYICEMRVADIADQYGFAPQTIHKRLRAAKELAREYVADGMNNGDTYAGS